MGSVGSAISEGNCGEEANWESLPYRNSPYPSPMHPQVLNLTSKSGSNALDISGKFNFQKYFQEKNPEPLVFAPFSKGIQEMDGGGGDIRVSELGFKFLQANMEAHKGFCHDCFPFRRSHFSFHVCFLWGGRRFPNICLRV